METNEERCFRHLKRTTYEEAAEVASYYVRNFSPYRDKEDGLTDEEGEIDTFFLNAYLLHKTGWTAAEYYDADDTRFTEWCKVFRT